MAKQLTRYVPTGYSLVREVSELGIQVYAKTEPKISAMFFGGKRSKPDWFYGFRSVESMNAQIDKSIEGLQQSKARVAQYRAERAAPTDVAVGDVFRCSWGYDQTNVDFYQVVAVKGAYVTVRAIAQMSEDTGYLQGVCAPAVNQFTGEPMRKKVQNSGGEPYFRVYSFASAYRLKPVAKVGAAAVYAASAWTAYA